MSVKPLVQIERDQFYDKDIQLRAPSDVVTDFGEELQQLVDNLVDTMSHHDIAVGLSAPQIGIHKRVAVVALDKLDEESEEPALVLVNPEILSFTGKKDTKRESCMSLPHYGGDVLRRTKMELNYSDREGNRKVLHAEGFLARVIAHEVDHLDGILFVDRMEEGVELVPVDIFKNDGNH